MTPSDLPAHLGQFALAVGELEEQLGKFDALFEGGKSFAETRGWLSEVRSQVNDIKALLHQNTDPALLAYLRNDLSDEVAALQSILNGAPGPDFSLKASGEYEEVLGDLDQLYDRLIDWIFQAGQQCVTSLSES